MSDGKDYTGLLLEDINGKFDVIVEAVGQIQDQIKVLPAMQSDLEEVKSDVKAIKAVVTDHSHQFSDHEQRIGTLESV